MYMNVYRMKISVQGIHACVVFMHTAARTNQIYLTYIYKPKTVIRIYTLIYTCIMPYHMLRMPLHVCGNTACTSTLVRICGVMLKIIAVDCLQTSGRTEGSLYSVMHACSKCYGMHAAALGSCTYPTTVFKERKGLNPEKSKELHSEGILTNTRN